MNPHRKKILELLKREGAELIRSGNHPVYRLPSGKIWVIASTPSDQRGDLNNMKALERSLASQPRVESQRGPQLILNKGKVYEVDPTDYERFIKTVTLGRAFSSRDVLLEKCAKLIGPINDDVSAWGFEEYKLAHDILQSEKQPGSKGPIPQPVLKYARKLNLRGKLVLFFRRIFRKTVVNSLRRLRAAYHEAGHAVAAEMMGYRVERAVLSRKTGEGHTEYVAGQISLEHQAVILMSGYIAEFVSESWDMDEAEKAVVNDKQILHSLLDKSTLTHTEKIIFINEKFVKAKKMLTEGHIGPLSVMAIAHGLDEKGKVSGDEVRHTIAFFRNQVLKTQEAQTPPHVRVYRRILDLFLGLGRSLKRRWSYIGRIFPPLAG